MTLNVTRHDDAVTAADGGPLIAGRPLGGFRGLEAAVSSIALAGPGDFRLFPEVSMFVAVANDGLPEPGAVSAIRLNAREPMWLRLTQGAWSFAWLAATDIGVGPGPGLSIAFDAPTATVQESVGTFANAFAIDRRGVTGDLIVNLTYAGTATGTGTDYLTAPASVIVPAGQSAGSFDISIVNDTLVEPNETIVISAQVAGHDAVAIRTVTIASDDLPTITWNSFYGEQSEAAGTRVNTLLLTRRGVTGDVVVDLSYSGTAERDVDFTGPSTVTFPGNTVSQQVSFVFIDDAEIEPDEYFDVSAQLRAYSASPATVARGVLLNNDAAANPTITLGNPNRTVSENIGTAIAFNAVLTNATGPLPFTITYSGTATPGIDFNGPTSGTFEAGQTTASFALTIINDTAVENDETASVTVTLENGSNFTRNLTIHDDDVVVPTVTFTTASVSDTEGASGAKLLTFTAMRSVTTGAVTAPVSFAAGGTNAADYTGAVLPSGLSFSWADGQASATLSISVNGDTVVEGDESFTLTLSPPSGYGSGATMSATGTILNDDAPLPYVMIHDFETVSGTPTSGIVSPMTLDTSNRHVLGTAGMRVLGNGSNPAMNISAIKNITDDPAGWSRIVMVVDQNTVLPTGMLSQARPSFVAGSNSYVYRTDPAAPGPINPFTTDARGKRYLSFVADRFRVTDWNGAKLTDSGTTTKALTVAFTLSNGTQTTTSPATSYAADIVVDALIRPAFHKAQFMFSFDDIGLEQNDVNFPLMQARGLTGTCYVPMGLVGTGSKMTLENLLYWQSQGWGMSVDSQRDDNPLTAASTRAAMIAAVNLNRDQMEAAGLGTASSRKQLCYGNGRLGYGTGSPTSTVTADGTDTVTTTTAFAFSSLAAGMRVKAGTGIPVGSTVVQVVADNRVKLSNPIPNTVTSMTFLARTLAVTTTCNGTTTVTVPDSSILFVGQLMTGYTVPANTKITAIVDATTITVSNAVPNTCPRADFELVDGEFHPTLVMADLIAAGYQSGRKVYTAPFGYYTGYGLDPLAAMDWRGYTLDTTASQAAHIAFMDQAALEGIDVIFYMHGVSNATYLAAIYDKAVALRDAGLIDVVPVHTGIETINARVRLQ